MSVSVGEPAIAAIATAAGAGGVGIIRISGGDATKIVKALVGRTKPVKDRRINYGRAIDESSGVLDEILYFVLKGPRSFTGEDVAEVHGHGGAINMGRLLRRIYQLGARPAEPGEFTRRALNAGRIDLVQAEALPGVVSARCEAGLRAAQSQLAGKLGEEIRNLSSDCHKLMARYEKEIDFPEDDVLWGSKDESLKAQIQNCREKTRRLEKTYSVGKAVTNGITVALRGAPNAGKSSLFNVLYGRERALVAEAPGTTRDFLEGATEWSGVPVEIVDTAGQRSTDCDLESRGIALGDRRSAECDVEIHLTEWSKGLRVPKGEGRQINVVSKIDLADEKEEGFSISTKTGFGLEELKAEVIRRVGAGGSSAEAVLVTTERQRDLLRQAGDALTRAYEMAEKSKATELVSSEIAAASEHLDGILGIRSRDEMLDALFREFCIGK